MGETMTVREALTATIKLLGDISVPRYLNDSIGIPIDDAINNIRICIDAMERVGNAPAEQEENENGRVDQDS